MKTLVALVLAATCGLSQAEVKGVAESPDGESIIFFHDKAGPCVGGALYVEHVIKKTKVMTPGCFVVNGPFASIVFFDTELGRVPLVAIKEPKQI